MDGRGVAGVARWQALDNRSRPLKNPALSNSHGNWSFWELKVDAFSCFLLFLSRANRGHHSNRCFKTQSGSLARAPYSSAEIDLLTYWQATTNIPFCSCQSERKTFA